MLEEAPHEEKLASVKPRYSPPFQARKKELCTPEEDGVHNSSKEVW